MPHNASNVFNRRFYDQEPRIQDTSGVVVHDVRELAAHQDWLDRILMGDGDDDFSKNVRAHERDQKTKDGGRKNRRSGQSGGNDPGCVEQFTKKYTSRNSPAYPANQCRGERMVGKDGRMYESVPASNGVWRWKEVKAVGGNIPGRPISRYHKDLINDAETLLKKCQQKKTDNEVLHSAEDAIKNSFIRQLAAGKLSSRGAVDIAKTLDKVTKTKYTRWFA